jgi:hypothetical protein
MPMDWSEPVPRQEGDRHGREREDDPEHEARRAGRACGIVQVVAEPVVAPAALGHQAQREPHERAERRLDGADVDGRHREQRGAGRGSSAAARRAGTDPWPDRAPRALPMSPLEAAGGGAPQRAPCGRDRRSPRGRTRAGAADHGVPARGVRSSYGYARLARLPARQAGGDHDVAEKRGPGTGGRGPGLGRGKRQDVGRRVDRSGTCDSAAGCADR